MLDAFIIEKIKREQEQAQSERMPLQIPTPRRPDPSRPSTWEDDRRRDDDEPRDRGVVIIDF
ncbi:MAG: hypothetical protein GY898_02895 [Proteobacteria bacterium]|nr:hypothetical protein [Pseudomonadota bacterium]